MHPPAALLLAMLLPSLAPTAAPVAFDSFTYTGRDDVFTAPLPAGHYRNPILAGYYPDPGICRVGDDYYLINSSFAHFPRILIFHSTDLVNWRQPGHVIDRPDQLDYDGLAITRGLFAPAIEHHDGVFYVVCTMVGAGGNFLVTATDPAGPWSNPVWLNFEGIDPSLFFDDDGRAWMLNNGNPPDHRPLYDGHRAIWIQEFDVTNRKLIGPRSILVNGGVDIRTKPVWIEGPHLYQKDGWYYLSCAEGGTSIHHSQVILRSKSVTGPYEPWAGNPILTQRDLDGNAPHAVTCTGHADLVIGPMATGGPSFLPAVPTRPTPGPPAARPSSSPSRGPPTAGPASCRPASACPTSSPRPTASRLPPQPTNPSPATSPGPTTSRPPNSPRSGSCFAPPKSIGGKSPKEASASRPKPNFSPAPATRPTSVAASNTRSLKPPRA
jgi:alpha-N-arabinofuranosidase